jgi:hypothetical protein
MNFKNCSIEIKDIIKEINHKWEEIFFIHIFEYIRIYKERLPLNNKKRKNPLKLDKKYEEALHKGRHTNV